MYPQYSTGYFCKLFGKTRQGWYEQMHRSSKQELSALFIIKLVQEIRRELPRIGVIKLYPMLKDKLQEHQIKIGRDGLYELLGQHGYLLTYRRRKPYTTDSHHRYKKYPNLIRELLLSRAGQLWVSDITYIRLVKGFCYLSIITDAYSRKIVGYHLHPSLHADGAIAALMMAISDSKRKGSVIHHSDRGTQYCCQEYVALLQSYHIQISMTEKGDPYENAIAERINGILKQEFDLDKTFPCFKEADLVVAQAVSRYNTIRPHSSCDYLTPMMAHEQSGWLRKRWKKEPSEIKAKKEHDRQLQESASKL